jgi:hypothetical protein
MSEEVQQEQQPVLPPIKLAFILDGEVVDILHTDERLSAIFTSNPIIVDVSDNLAGNGGIVGIGSAYNSETQQFSAPEPQVAQG